MQNRIGGDGVLYITAVERFLAAFHVVTEIVRVSTVGEHIRNAEFFTALGVGVARHYHHHAPTSHVVGLGLTSPHAFDLALGVAKRDEFLQELRIAMLDVVHVNHHVVAHLQCEVELVDLRARASIGGILGIQ